MFIKITVKEARNHIGKYAHLQNVNEVECAGVITKQEEQVGIAFGEEGKENFIELHALSVGERSILLWAAPGKPDYSLLEPVKQDDPYGNTSIEDETVHDNKPAPSVGTYGAPDGEAEFSSGMDEA